MNIESLMMTEIQKLHDTETQLVTALTYLASKAQDQDLRDALTEHRTETEEHARRLEEVCQRMGWQWTGQQSLTTRAMIQEAQMLLDDMMPSPVTDVCIVGAAQRAEHLEMAAYGTIATLADEMDRDEIKDLLGQTLEEEKHADKKLSKLAEHGINRAAVESSTNRATLR